MKVCRETETMMALCQIYVGSWRSGKTGTSIVKPCGSESRNRGGKSVWKNPERKRYPGRSDSSLANEIDVGNERLANLGSSEMGKEGFCFCR